MLKNVSSQAVELRWGGETVTLLPGQVMRYKDPRVELRQKAKHVKELEHTPEPKSAEETKSHVVMESAPGTEADPGAPQEAPRPAMPTLACGVCEFVAKTTQGLDTHIRSKHAS